MGQSVAARVLSKDQTKECEELGMNDLDYLKLTVVRAVEFCHEHRPRMHDKFEKWRKELNTEWDIITKKKWLPSYEWNFPPWRILPQLAKSTVLFEDLYAALDTLVAILDKMEY